nr:hypothetical protein [Tanacetum cinerariifolium]
MSQPPNEPGYFTHLLKSNPQQYSSSPNQSNPSTSGSQNSNSSSQPFPHFATQMSPDQAYHSQLAYHQQQQYDFQNYSNPRNTPSQFFSQPHYFPQQSSQPPFKVPQAKYPRDSRRRQKNTGKQPVVDLDDGDDDDMAASGESDADLIENAKTSYIERCGKKFQYDHVWSILNNYPKWNAAEPIEEDNLQELFGPDPRERPAGKQRAPKKQKSVDTSSTGGSQSESVSSLVSQDYRRKCDAAERAYGAKREKELAMMQCIELKFLMLDPSSLPRAKRAIIEKKQVEIMRKYPDA